MLQLVNKLCKKYSKVHVEENPEAGMSVRCTAQSICERLALSTCVSIQYICVLVAAVLMLMTPSPVIVL